MLILSRIEPWPHFGLQETDTYIIKGLANLVYLKSKRKWTIIKISKKKPV